MTNFIAGGKLIAHITGIPFLLGVVVIAAIIMPYLVIGGFDAVVRTDVVQYAALVVIAILIALSFASGSGGEAVGLDDPIGIGQIISFFVIGLFFPMGSAELWQRVYATHDRVQLKKAIVIASVSFLIIGTALSVMGLRLRANLSANITDVDLGLVDGVAQSLGTGFAGLWIIAFGAAIISSADTFVYTSASSLIQDVRERLGSRLPSDRIKSIRLAIVALTILGIICAWIIGSIVDVTFVFAGITMIIGASAICVWIYPRIPAWVIVWAPIVGFSALVVEAALRGISAITAIAGLGTCVIILLIGVVVTLIKQKTRSQS